MKRINLFPTIIASLFIFSCGANYNGYLIKNAAKAIDLNYSILNGDGYKAYQKNLINVESELISNFYEFNKSDFLISPTSIISALNMLQSSLTGKPQKEILSILNDSSINIESNYSNLYSLLNRNFRGNNKIATSNSVWLNSTFEDSYNEKTLNKLANSYYTNSFGLDFNDKEKSRDTISQYIKDATNNLLNCDNLNINPDTVFILLNTLYLKDIWLIDNELKYTSETFDFNNEDGSIKKVKLLTKNRIAGRPIEEEIYSKFFIETNGGLTLEFIVPSEGYQVEDIFNLSNINEILSSSTYSFGTETESYYTNIYFPSFSSSGTYDLIDFFKAKYNLNEVFKPSYENAIFDDLPTCVTKIVHSNILNVDEVGIEGASYTLIEDAATSTEPKKEIYFDYYVTKGFIFTLKDSYGNFLFAGTLTNLSN